VIIFPFEKELALYLNKLEFPSCKDNLAYWFWRRRFLKIFIGFLLFWIFTFLLLSTLGERLSPAFKQT
jgi:hypothetical protein